MNTRKTFAAALAAALLSLAAWSGQALGQDIREVTALGMGSITGGDVAHAKDDAVEDALRNAIEQTLGTLIQSETLAQNFTVVEDNIFSKTQGYIQKYEILEQGKRDAMLYEVKVRAWVRVSDLKDDLDAVATLIRRKKTPRLMVLIDEKNIGETATAAHFLEADLNTAESQLMNQFMKKGFRFVDAATVRQNLDREKEAAILEGDARQAAAVGRRSGAEVVLVGKALAKAVEVEAFGAKIRSQQATVTVKAIRTDTGDLLAIGTEQGKFTHIDDVTGGTRAIQKACDALAEPLIAKILDRWSTDVNTGGTLTLKIRNVGDYAELNRFKNSLKYYVRGITNVTQRDFSNGFAVLELEMKGNADDLANRLSTAKMEGFIVKVTGVSEGGVTVTLVPSASAAPPPAGEEE
ncbi:hypothetical protein JW777_01880 [bacterium]|nr:hypothetical protein [bacterium]